LLDISEGAFCMCPTKFPYFAEGAERAVHLP
jgi:hypothetical protein